MKWTPRRLKAVLNLYPPYLGAGIRVTHIDPGWRELRVEMKLRWRNRNAVGTHFGGNLYSMVDPHLMLLLMQLLGEEYVVWDQTARIRFVRPGTGRVRAVIRVTDDDLVAIRSGTADGATYKPVFSIEILDESGAVVATVEQGLHIRRRAP